MFKDISSKMKRKKKECGAEDKENVAPAAKRKVTNNNRQEKDLILNNDSQPTLNPAPLIELKACISQIALTPPTSPKKPKSDCFQEGCHTGLESHLPAKEHEKGSYNALKGSWFLQEKMMPKASQIGRISEKLNTHSTFQKYKELARNRIEKEKILNEKRKAQKEKQELLEEKGRLEAEEEEKEKSVSMNRDWSFFPTPPSESSIHISSYDTDLEHLRRTEQEQRRRAARGNNLHLCEQRDVTEAFENYSTPRELLHCNKKYNMYSKYSWEKQSFVCQWVEVQVPYVLK